MVSRNKKETRRKHDTGSIMGLIDHYAENLTESDRDTIAIGTLELLEEDLYKDTDAAVREAVYTFINGEIDSITEDCNVYTLQLKDAIELLNLMRLAKEEK